MGLIILFSVILFVVWLIPTTEEIKPKEACKLHDWVYGPDDKLVCQKCGPMSKYNPRDSEE